MKQILCHGLGESAQQWEAVRKKLLFQTEIPDLFGMTKTDSPTYQALYAAFEAYCTSWKEPLQLCGLSLGGILALDYAANHPSDVESLILIGTPYKIPPVLFWLQCCIFHMLPRKAFSEMGISKENATSLMQSASRLDIPGMVSRIGCKTLILCGERDHANQKSAVLLHHRIKNSSLSIVRSAGHQVNTDKPLALADEINQFWMQSTIPFQG